MSMLLEDMVKSSQIDLRDVIFFLLVTEKLYGLFQLLSTLEYFFFSENSIYSFFIALNIKQHYTELSMHHVSSGYTW